MFKKIKNMFGIDGVKISLDAPAELDLGNKIVKFNLIVTSKSDLVLDSVSIKLIEKYKRGWGDSKLINEYVLYENVEDLDLLISPEEKLTAPMTVSFNYTKSAVEKLAEKRILRPFVKIAMLAKRVKSTFRLEVVAKVKGVRMNPLAVHKFSKGTV